MYSTKDEAMQNSRLVPVFPISTSITQNNCSKDEVYPLKIILELSNERDIELEIILITVFQ